MSKSSKDENDTIYVKIAALGAANGLGGIVAGVIAYTTGDVALGISAATMAASGLGAAAMTHTKKK